MSKLPESKLAQAGCLVSDAENTPKQHAAPPIRYCQANVISPQLTTLVFHVTAI